MQFITTTARVSVTICCRRVQRRNRAVTTTSFVHDPLCDPCATGRHTHTHTHTVARTACFKLHRVGTLCVQSCPRLGQTKPKRYSCGFFFRGAVYYSRPESAEDHLEICFKRIVLRAGCHAPRPTTSEVVKQVTRVGLSVTVL